MSRDLCEIAFILDNSGSMAGLEGDTMGSFNKIRGIPHACGMDRGAECQFGRI